MWKVIFSTGNAQEGFNRNLSSGEIILNEVFIEASPKDWAKHGEKNAEEKIKRESFDAGDLT